MNDNDLVQAAAFLRQSRHRMIEQIEKVIVGQTVAVDAVVTACFAGGHCLLIGPSGVAKTSLVNAVSRSLDLTFNRIQFTADLMPSDILGSKVLFKDPDDRRRLEFEKGPIFTNLLLADEINRATPRTQSALLQAMAEQKVSFDGQDYELEPPFCVFGTQNPLDGEGTYPLPEAQLDRFLFSVDIRYPEFVDEIEIIRRATTQPSVSVEPVMHRLDVLKCMALVRQVGVSDIVLDYVARLVRATRPDDDAAPRMIRQYIRTGGGPRSGIGIVRAAQARALLEGRSCVESSDVAYVASAVLQHRCVINFDGHAEGVDASSIVEGLLRLVSP